MLFNSTLFFAFFAVVVLVRFAPKLGWTTRKVLLLLGSYAFYAAWYPPHILILLTSTFIDWHVAQWIHRSKIPRRRKWLLVISLVVNLGMLAVFKYTGFAVENVAALMHALGFRASIPSLSLLLPVGISFYTFEALSYTIEVYRGKIPPAESFIDFALFITFFPRMVAGPIMRAEAFIPQCRAERRVTLDEFAWGMVLLVFGLFQKVVLADGIFAPTSDLVFASQRSLPWTDAWIGTFAFAGQILFDFAGYSTCAIGIAFALGFQLPANFRTPYAAAGFSDLWRRWHVSLSSWLRDYLYVSLGGNRRGPVRTYFNLVATMVLGGLWHGAAWTFVVWGSLHGLFLVIERLVETSAWSRGLPPSQRRKLARALLTFAGVCVAWVFFRAQSFGTALRLVRAMFGLGASGAEHVVGLARAGWVLFATFAMLATQWFMRERSLDWLWGRLSTPIRAAAVALMVILLVTSPGDDRAFIYFQF